MNRQNITPLVLKISVSTKDALIATQFDTTDIIRPGVASLHQLFMNEYEKLCGGAEKQNYKIRWSAGNSWYLMIVINK